MLKIDRLTFTYPGHNQPVLREISTEVLPGKVVLVTGPSGSGKSTLLHCINGLATNYYDGQAEGDICVAGRETFGQPLWQLSELVGTIFQNPNTQFFQLTVEDEIAFGMEHANIPSDTIDRRITQALHEIGIESLRYRDLFSLSSGEKQKVALASIMALDQPLLLLDEPTANLDIASIHELGEIIHMLKNQGRTIIISEHRLWYLRELADQVLVLKDGRIIYDGPPCQLESARFRHEIGLRMWDRTLESVHESKRKASPPTPSEPVLQVHNLCGGPDKGVPIVNDFSFDFLPGQCIGIMGHNGAGKTMLSRIVTGLQKETSGAIRIKNQLLKAKQRVGRIACVSQHADQQLFADTVLAELLLNAEDLTHAEKTARKLLEDFDLTPLQDRHPQTLSGGEKQRLAIAAAMTLEPEIIILDEPTSGMDCKRMQQLVGVIENLCERGLLVIVITHDMELAALACNEILWMENGTIKQRIEPDAFGVFFDDLIHRPATERKSI